MILASAFIAGFAFAGWAQQPPLTVNPVVNAPCEDVPIRFNDTPTQPTVTPWTTCTRAMNPASFGCSEGGGTAADWDKVWDVNGWNPIRVKFHDGLNSGREVRMKTWPRKAASGRPVEAQVEGYARPIG